MTTCQITIMIDLSTCLILSREEVWKWSGVDCWEKGWTIKPILDEPFNSLKRSRTTHHWHYLLTWKYIHSWLWKTEKANQAFYCCMMRVTPWIWEDQLKEDYALENSTTTTRRSIICFIESIKKVDDLKSEMICLGERCWLFSLP